MEQKKEKGLRIRSCLTGAIWLALVFSTAISALLFAFLNHFFYLPGSIPVLGWLLIFNTLIAGLITSFRLDDDYAKGTIRVSLGKNNTKEDAEKIAAALVKIVG